MMIGLLWFGLGFAVGWLVFKRPAWVEFAFGWVKSKLGMP